MGPRRRLLAKNWLPTLIAAVLAFLLYLSTRRPYIGLIAFLVLVRLWYRAPAPRQRPATDDDKAEAPAHEGATSAPLEIPRSQRWYSRFTDRLAAARRRQEADGFRMNARPRRCIHCHYDLTGLPDHHTCPECGRAYTFADIDAYFDDPATYERERPDAP